MKLLILISCIVLMQTLEAQISMPNIVNAEKIEEPVKLDGKLDEDVWQKTQVITNFTQRVQNEGQAGTQDTEVRLLYTETELYIGVRLWDDNPDAIVAKQMKRDFQYWTEDNFVVIIDTYLSKRDGYIFAVNSNGAKSDVYSSDEARTFNLDWNGIWEVETTIDEEGWNAEIRIPFSTLKFPDTEEQVWGINFQRRIIRTQEQDFWQGWSRDRNFEHVSNAGTLTGLKNIKGHETLELKPYVTTGYETNGRDESVIKAGGEANYSFTPNLRLNLTANTDFAQVESDRAQINLSRFSLYFPEKRDFFLRGQDFFSFNMLLNTELFYSRRIGIQNGEQIPILGGARLMGTSGNTTIGAMSIQTGNKGEVPTANFSTFRIKQNIFERSYIGMILSSRVDEGVQNYNYGIDFNYKYTELFGDKNLIFQSSVAQSLFSNKKSKNDFAYNFVLNLPNDEFYYSLAYQKVKENFRPMTGFVNRNTYDFIHTEYVYKPRLEKSNIIRQLTLKPFEFNAIISDSTREVELFEYQLRPIGFATESGESFYFTYIRQFERLYNGFEIFGDAFIPADEYNINLYSAQFNSFDGRQLYVNAKYKWGGFYNGDMQEYSSSLNLNLGRHLNVSADYTRNSIRLPDNSFNADEFGGRIEYAFNPDMNTSLFGQWNNERDEMILNFRFHWIPQPGSNIFLVFNQLVDTHNSLELKDTAILTKLVWRFGV